MYNCGVFNWTLCTSFSNERHIGKRIKGIIMTRKQEAGYKMADALVEDKMTPYYETGR